MKCILSKFGGKLMALPLIAVVSLVVLAAPRAFHPRPFHLVEHGTLTQTPRDQSNTVIDVVAEGTGTATHLGAITVHRTFTLTATDKPGIFDVDGEATLTAATGETLTTEIKGTFDAVVGHASLAYGWTGGTGRFEHATGDTSWSVDVANGEYDAVANGEIIF
jgi:hypothetical protein